jgi:acetyl esterase
MTTRSLVMHPEAARQLARIAASGEPPLERLAPAEARRVADARVMDNGWERSPMHAVTELVMRGPGGPLALRLYKPNSNRPLPLIMFFHGGGFMVGNLDTHDSLCRVLAARTDAALLAVDYRLAPEHRFPAAPEDCLAATRWAIDHAEDLGVDPRRVAVVGESSGGTLSAVVAQALAGNDQLVLQAMIYPSLDMGMDTPSYTDLAIGFFFTRSKARFFFDHYLNSRDEINDARASPLRAESVVGVCPALIIAAALDPMVDEAALYAERLRIEGVSVEFHSYAGWPHGFLFWAHTEAAERAIDRTAMALRTAFREKS